MNVYVEMDPDDVLSEIGATISESESDAWIDAAVSHMGSYIIIEYPRGQRFRVIVEEA